MSRVLVTGAEGFVGRQLIKLLLAEGHFCISVARNHDTQNVEQLRCVNLTITGETDWRHALIDIDVVIHLANMAHVGIQDEQLDSLFNINVEATAALVEQAEQSGVKQFIYISSSKVYGEPGPEKINDDTVVSLAECDAYGQSKIAAERAVQAICNKSSTMFYTIFRPPLIYGPGVKGNLARLMKLAISRWPLPKIQAPRSVLSVFSLTDAIRHCIFNSKATNQVFLLCDPEPMSFANWITAFRSSLNKTSRLFPVPIKIIGWLMTAIGYKEEFNKLARPMVISSSRFEKQLDWHRDMDRITEIQDMLQAKE